MREQKSPLTSKCRRKYCKGYSIGVKEGAQAKSGSRCKGYAQAGVARVRWSEGSHRGRRNALVRVGRAVGFGCWSDF